MSSSNKHPNFLEIEATPGTGLVVQAPARMLIPLFPTPIMWINQNPNTGRAQVVLANGTQVEAAEGYFDLKQRLELDGLGVISKALVDGSTIRKD